MGGIAQLASHVARSANVEVHELRVWRRACRVVDAHGLQPCTIHWQVPGDVLLAGKFRPDDANAARKRLCMQMAAVVAAAVAAEGWLVVMM